MTVILLKDGHIINPVLIFQSVLMLDKWMNNDQGDAISYNPQWEEAFLMCV